MTKETPTLPRLLGDVLHDEYVRLYGPGEPFDRGWNVRAEDVVDARGLAEKLERRGAFSGDWSDKQNHDIAFRQAVADAINTVLGALGATWLWSDKRFDDANQPPFGTLAPATEFDAIAVAELNRQIFDALFPHELRSLASARYRAVVRLIHKQAKENGRRRTALSISGGGIRSATFALGVMQGLAKCGLLDKFDFLSTVSGGGYIGGWLSSWMRRDRWGIRGISAILAARPADELEPEPVPLRHLRAYSNYLTPRLGALSADTWALVAIYLRNLLLNWAVLIPLLAAVVALPRLMMSAVVHPALDVAICGRIVSSSTIAFGIGAALLGIALLFLIANRPIFDEKTTKQFTDRRFLTWCLLPFVASAFALLLAWAWYVRENQFHAPNARLSWFISGGIILTLLAFVWFAWRVSRAGFTEVRVAAEKQQEHKTNRVWAEFVASITAGAVGGTLAWLLTGLFHDPIPNLVAVSAIHWPLGDAAGLQLTTALYVCLGVPALLGVLFLQSVVFVGMSSQQNQDFDREWWARASGWVLIGGVMWAVVSAITIFGPIAIYHLPKLLSAAGGAAGIFSVLVGWSAKTGGGKKDEEKPSILTKIALSLAVPLFVLYILALVSTGTTAALAPRVAPNKPTSHELAIAELASNRHTVPFAGRLAEVTEKPIVDIASVRSYEHVRTLRKTVPLDVVKLAAILLGVALIVSRSVGVNVFSMHAMYRNRLVRAYLGASRWNREPNAFTGFDANDNLPMHNLRPEYVWWHSFRNVATARDLLVAPGASPRLTFLRKKLEAIGPITADASALAQAMNALIATDDLAHDFDSTVVAADASTRPLRNRRFIEKAFDDKDIYPSPMPLLCVSDIVDEKGFVKAFSDPSNVSASAIAGLFVAPKPSDLSSLLGEINTVIATGKISALPGFNAPLANAAPFLWDAADGLHAMIDNRLRIERTNDLKPFIKALVPARPLHMINTTLNLTTGAELGWQERKAESLTVSPLASGNYRLGYRDTREYGEISLGTAVTISGAAASPNMGYHSSPALAFLMTLFNVRLGWWLGNPGIAGNKTYGRRNPKYSIVPFLSEATGNSDDLYPYVYLSDGGHFENLGLYEMVLRRCHDIIVSDAAADPKYIYDDLGNAIRKIRIDLGVPIEIKHIGILPPTKKPRSPQRYCAVGKILYSAVDDDAVDGNLLYIKPVVYEDAGPRDVLNYASNSDSFPHESTADQFFSESQFESYRALGAFTVDEVTRLSNVPNRLESINALITAVDAVLTAEAPKQ